MLVQGWQDVWRMRCNFDGNASLTSFVSSSSAFAHVRDARIAFGPCPAPGRFSMGALWQDASRHLSDSISGMS